MRWALILVTLVGCGPRSPHAVADAFILAVDRNDIDAAKKLIVSPEQVGQLIECASASQASWNTPAGRQERVAKRLASYAAHDPTRGHVHLGELWEEYDKPAQWHSYKTGDAVGDGCHAKAAFEIRNYRIQLDFNDSKVSTKPIELWGIAGSWYVWDDPLDTEGW